MLKNGAGQEGGSEMRRTLTWLAALTIALGAAACGPAVVSKPGHPQLKPVPAQRHTAGAKGIPAAAQTCMAALAPLGVPVSYLLWPSNVPPWPRVTLAPSLAGGPVSRGNRESAVATAYENLLSSAVGLPLATYFGRTLTEVNLYGGRQGAALSGYVCLENRGRVVGAWGEEGPNADDPGGLATVQGQSFLHLTGTNFLAWLLKNGYYAPHATANSSSFTAEEALANSFAVMNDPSLPPRARTRLLATYYTGGRGAPGLPSDLRTLVPIGISRVTWGPEATADPRTEQQFSVGLWPDWRTYPPPAQDLAGDGWQGFFYTMVRSSVSRMWIIQSYATGP